MSGSALLNSVERHTRLAGYNCMAVLVFTLGDEQWFGINVFKVREVLRKPPLARLPNMHELLAGSFDYRGTTIPVIDLGKVFGYPPLSSVDGGHLVVTEFNRSMQGFLVARFEHIAYCSGESMIAPSPTLGFGGRVGSICRVDGHMLAMVDLEHVLASVDGGTAATVSHALCEQAGKQTEAHRVLVVDDSMVARQQLVNIFRQMHMECVVAQDGREALELLQSMVEKGSGLVDLVVSDIEMPRLDGYALTRAIRDVPALRRIKVVLHSSLSGIFNETLVHEVGADRFIAKFQPDLLAEAVIELMAPSTN